MEQSSSDDKTKSSDDDDDDDIFSTPSHLPKTMERIQAENQERLLAEIEEDFADRSSAPSPVVSSRTDMPGHDSEESLPSDDASRASRNESSPSSRHVRFVEEEKEELTPREEKEELSPRELSVQSSTMTGSTQSLGEERRLAHFNVGPADVETRPLGRTRSQTRTNSEIVR